MDPTPVEAKPPGNGRDGITRTKPKREKDRKLLFTGKRKENLIPLTTQKTTKNHDKHAWLFNRNFLSNS